MGDELYMTTRRDFLRTLIAGGAGVAVTPNTLLVEIGKAFAHRSDGPFELIMPGILMRIKPPVFPKRDLSSQSLEQSRTEPRIQHKLSGMQSQHAIRLAAAESSYLRERF
jgi:hypothetical protein